jgi:hypothetical protein
VQLPNGSGPRDRLIALVLNPAGEQIATATNMTIIAHEWQVHAEGKHGHSQTE